MDGDVGSDFGRFHDLLDSLGAPSRNKELRVPLSMLDAVFGGNLAQFSAQFISNNWSAVMVSRREKKEVSVCGLRPCPSVPGAAWRSTDAAQVRM